MILNSQINWVDAVKPKVRKKHAAILIAAAILLWQREGVACAFVPEYQGGAIESRTLSGALSRISDTYGQPLAHLYVVDGASPLTRWLFNANAYGKSISIPGKSCVVIGPNGTNVDVLSHELVHAEIAYRVGYWAYLTRMPTWFDEGAAMQVDYRPQYELPDSKASADQLRNLPSTSAFFSGDDATLTKRYGLAKRAVADWLKRNGGKGKFYQQLEQFRNGEDELTIR